MSTPNPDLWARNRGKSLGEILSRKPSIAFSPAEPQSTTRGGSEMPGSMTLPEPGKPLPYWWPRR